MDNACPVCETGMSTFHATIDGYDYWQCGRCSSLHISNDTLAAIDAGHGVRLYDDAYWQEELRSARERARGESLVRAGEAILYCQRAVTRFLDIGTGPGYLLDELSSQLPRHPGLFHGVELFPPEERTAHPNYIEGDVATLDQLFDAGVCIEVIEHLTPGMLARLAEGLARVSKPGSLWLFNTGMPDYVLREDPGYLDPLRRGHIVSYSLQGLAHIFGPYGFQIEALPGKSYAFVAELGVPPDGRDFAWRMNNPLDENVAILKEAGLLYQAVVEAAKSSFYQSEYDVRTAWALQLEDDLEKCRSLVDHYQSEYEARTAWALQLDAELEKSREVAARYHSEYLARTEWALSLQRQLEARRGKWAFWRK